MDDNKAKVITALAVFYPNGVPVEVVNAIFPPDEIPEKWLNKDIYANLELEIEEMKIERIRCGPRLLEKAEEIYETNKANGKVTTREHALAQALVEDQKAKALAKIKAGLKHGI